MSCPPAFPYVDGTVTSPANGGVMCLYFGRRAGYPVSNLQAWGGQVERAPFASSFIYTDGTAGGPANTGAPDQLTFTTTPAGIRSAAWEVGIYPRHGSDQDAYDATTLPLVLRDQEFGLFAWSGDSK